MRYQTFKAFWLLLSKGKLANKMQIETLPWCRAREMIDDMIFVFATYKDTIIKSVNLFRFEMWQFRKKIDSKS